MNPPTSSPSRYSARPHAAPRAQRTSPMATAGAHLRRAPRCSGRAYFRSVGARARSQHRREQYRACAANASNSRRRSRSAEGRRTPGRRRDPLLGGWPGMSRRGSGFRVRGRSHANTGNRIDLGQLGTPGRIRGNRCLSGKSGGEKFRAGVTGRLHIKNAQLQLYSPQAGEAA